MARPPPAVPLAFPSAASFLTSEQDHKCPLFLVPGASALKEHRRRTPLSFLLYFPSSPSTGPLGPPPRSLPPFFSYFPSFPSTGPLDPPPRPHPPLFSYFPSTPSSGVLYPFAPLSPSFAFFPSYFPYFPSFLLSTGFLVPIHPTNSPTPLFSYFPSTPSSNGDRNAPAVKGKCVP